MKTDHYTYRVTWSPDDHEHVGLCVEFPSLSWLAETPEEAFAYLTSLQQILIYGGVSDADMEKGGMRCDANVSVRPIGQEELGRKVEVKNRKTGAREELPLDQVVARFG